MHIHTHTHAHSPLSEEGLPSGRRGSLCLLPASSMPVSPWTPTRGPQVTPTGCHLRCFGALHLKAAARQLCPDLASYCSPVPLPALQRSWHHPPCPASPPLGRLSDTLLSFPVALIAPSQPLMLTVTSSLILVSATWQMWGFPPPSLDATSQFAMQAPFPPLSPQPTDGHDGEDFSSPPSTPCGHLS